MKKILFVFFVFSISIAQRASGLGLCAGKGHVSDYKGKSYNCSCNRNGDPIIYDGTVLLTKFPNGRKCSTKNINHFEDEAEALCAGWNIAEYDSSVHEEISALDSSTTCWKWKCRETNFVFELGSHSKCIDEEILKKQKKEQAECYAKISAGSHVLFKSKCIPFCNASSDVFKGDGTFVSFGNEPGKSE